MANKNTTEAVLNITIESLLENEDLARDYLSSLGYNPDDDFIPYLHKIKRLQSLYSQTTDCNFSMEFYYKSVNNKCKKAIEEHFYIFSNNTNFNKCKIGFNSISKGLDITLSKNESSKEIDNLLEKICEL